ncbi:MAG: cyclodeaminase [Sphaerochaetaceae bacterium]|jgi:ornithine cyclodeaminase|nr:cyclodeaminase [Sphaerochaetaceae bacterium]MDX9939047.1 cyclodeaminase [Sphaerochaetaceae bacterium]
MSNGILVLSEQELRKFVQLDMKVIEKIELGFSELAAGKATVPPIMMLPVPEKNGEVDIKSAFIKGLPSMAIKIASGFFQNPDIGLPSQSGQMLVVSAETGFLEAVLLDNGFLTQVRTAAAGAIAAKYLAPDGVDTVGVFGCGVQARYQMEALMLVKPYKRLLMYSIDTDERKQAFVKDMQQKLGIEVKSMGSAGAMVAECGIVVTTTPSRKGYFEPEWVHSGLHITSMGSDAEDKQELKGGVFAKADLIACDLRAQSFRLGELRGAKEEGFVTDKTPVKEIGEIIRTGKSARTDKKQVTICDLTGVGVQDTMIALMAYEIAKREKAGIVVPR